MRSLGVVVHSPLLDDDLRFTQAVEDFLVETFVAELSVEAFAVAVFPWATGFDVERLRSDVAELFAHDLGGHLRPIIGTDMFGDATRNHGVCHCLDDTKGIDPSSDTDGEALTSELIDQSHQPQFAAVMGSGFDEVVGPDMIAVLRP